MTVTLFCCRELALDLPMLTNFQEHYWVIEKSATPTALLLPWFPSPAQRAKKASTKVLFGTLQHYIEKRKKAPVPSSDAIDVLLAEGSSNVDIIQFVFGIIFAGVINTSMSSTSLVSGSPDLSSILYSSLLAAPVHFFPFPLENRHPCGDPRPPCPTHQPIRAAPQTALHHSHRRMGG
jgi:hypothetical protein